MTSADSRTRLDSWLWAARFFKTRTLAARAIDGGRIDVNDQRAKRSTVVRIGDWIAIRQGPFRHRVEVRGLSSRRGPAAEAALLYQETAESRAAREELRARLAAAATSFHEGAGRPTKKQRREIDRWKGKAD